MRFTKLNSEKKVWVKIDKYKIKWDKPSASKLQTVVKNFLEPFWKNYIVLEEMRIPGSLLRCDFLNLSKKLALEVQGRQHDNYNKFFHKNRNNYFFSIRRDFKKLEWLEKNGFTVIEVNEDEVPSLSLQFFALKFGLNIL